MTGRTRRLRDEIEVAGERLGYELFEFDARTEEQRAGDERRGALAGDLLVIIPGHGQTADSARHLIETSATRSKSGVAWSVDIDPPRGGDPVKAAALPAVIRQRLPALFPPDRRSPGAAPQAGVTLFGWSHGGGEALRTAELDGQLFQHVVGICPAGLVERRLPEVLASFLLECLRIVWFALRRGGWTYLRRVLSIGANIARGVIGDLLRTGSVRRVLSDMRWAARKVPGRSFRYNGNAALIFGAQDTVIRWRDVFPACRSRDQIPASLGVYRQSNFPHVRRLDVRVLDGNHLSPETDGAFAVAALDLSEQLASSR
jgi:pimeloyl-ACP methyl ester carboxylesterase